MAKKILIFGFPHCGTSILKSIMCHIPDIEEVVDETCVINRSTDKKFILCKYPLTKNEFFSPLYKDYIKIFILRNPVFVMSSLNKRFKYNLPLDNTVPAYVDTLLKFIFASKSNMKDLYTIRYEDMFDNNYKKLRDIFDRIGLNYTDDIFDNSKYENKTISGIELVKDKPQNTDHAKYRTWQINQPFVINNDISKLDLTEEQKRQIRGSAAIMSTFPEINDLNI